jgi:peptide-methionine (S)-S-oxide reductase
MRILLALLLPVVGLFANAAQAAERAVTIPAPAVDEVSSHADKQTVVLAGGCFWGVQAVFQHTKGVTSAVSGYAGGDKSTAHYEMVGSGRTGHAESVAVTFDPHTISLGKILQIYFSVAHNPTELNRQGPDTGTQYRSAIFFAGDEQKKIAARAAARLLSGGRLSPGFCCAAPIPRLHRVQRSAEGGQSEAVVCGRLP